MRVNIERKSVHVIHMKNVLYLEPFLIDHLAGVECTHGIYLHYCPEGVEGEGGSWAEEVSSSICQKQHQDHFE